MDLLIRHPWLVVALVIGRILLWVGIERRWRLYPATWPRTLFSDVATTLVLVLITVPLGDRLLYRLGVANWIPALWPQLPLWSRIGLYVVLADCGHYWLHRLMHTQTLWSLHRWHHAPTHMNWLAGNRESLPDRLLVSLPYIGLSPLLADAPGRVWVALLLLAVLRNDWMHLNTAWGWRWLEQVFVTPRYHHIHHSADPQHHNKNIGIFFTVWDRLFGTYVQPESTVGHIRFGIDQQVPLARLYTGT